jgi:trimethylamine--corrinoid protein Co-methyltransferase
VARDCHNGAIFISDAHTFKHFKQSLFHPQLANRSRFEQWHEMGAKEMHQRCNERARQILADHQVVPKPDAVIEGIAALLSGQSARSN